MWELQKLVYHTQHALADVEHEEEPPKFQEYAFAATTTQLQSHSEGQTVITIPHTFKKAMA